MEADYLLQGRFVPEWHLYCIAEAVFHLWGEVEVDYWHPNVPAIVSMMTPWKIHLLREP